MKLAIFLSVLSLILASAATAQQQTVCEWRGDTLVCTSNPGVPCIDRAGNLTYC